jgi:hypothetical protein
MGGGETTGATGRGGTGAAARTCACAADAGSRATVKIAEAVPNNAHRDMDRSR